MKDIGHVARVAYEVDVPQPAGAVELEQLFVELTHPYALADLHALVVSHRVGGHEVVEDCRVGIEGGNVGQGPGHA